MLDLVEASVTTEASLNYAADRSSGGIWSNGTPGMITQKLEPHRVPICDARAVPAPPSIAVEGFQLAHAPLGGYDWENEDWVVSVYVPHAVELVRRLTGAPYVVTSQNGVLIRDTGDLSKPRAAEFVHLDQDRAFGAQFVGLVADPAMRALYPRAMIFNVWRAITPPPQDVPLALCDQRTLDERDWVVGRTIETEYPDGITYVTSVHNPGQRWYYYSDLTVDDAIVFKNYDSDPDAPLGCLHGAFRQTDVPAGAVPRASAETRVAAFFAE